MGEQLEPATLTVVGNLAVDRVDGGTPTPGGCPSFAAAAFTQLGAPGRIVTKRAVDDEAVFADSGGGDRVPTTILDAAITNGFELDYDGERRTMAVTAVGEPWELGDLLPALQTAWVHAAPLLRGEFPLATLTGLRARGHRLSFDGQGLVRIPDRGPMRTDADYDPAILDQLSVLKLADDEAAVVAAGTRFTAVDARRLRVPEIIVTFGSVGADVYLDGELAHVQPAVRVDGVHTTGSGDMFAVGYAAARAAGTEPLVAAQRACDLVAEVLLARRAALSN